jgi:hypothetical protein
MSARFPDMSARSDYLSARFPDMSRSSADT